MFRDDLMLWSENVNSLYATVSKFISENKLPKLPSFDTATTRKGLYEAYAAVVEINNGLSSYLSVVQQMLMMKSQYKGLLKAENYGVSVTQVMNSMIEDVSEKITIIDRMLNTYKYGVENQLRFYQSVQYIMSSPRLSSYD